MAKKKPQKPTPPPWERHRAKIAAQNKRMPKPMRDVMRGLGGLGAKAKRFAVIATPDVRDGGSYKPLSNHATRAAAEKAAAAWTGKCFSAKWGAGGWCGARVYQGERLVSYTSPDLRDGRLVVATMRPESTRRAWARAAGRSR